jgi:hypothetical protein
MMSVHGSAFGENMYIIQINRSQMREIKEGWFYMTHVALELASHLSVKTMMWRTNFVVKNTEGRECIRGLSPESHIFLLQYYL